MKLRNHPWMIRRSGMKEWPPLWVDVRGWLHKAPHGEVGYLKRVDQHPDISNGLFLWIEFEGESYVGTMHFDDSSFCREVCSILESHIGHDINDIGDLDISYTL